MASMSSLKPKTRSNLCARPAKENGNTKETKESKKITAVRSSFGHTKVHTLL